MLSVVALPCVTPRQPYAPPKFKFNPLGIMAQALLSPLAQPPALLHGSLWLGSCGSLGGTDPPAVFDPACWYGLPEADLALLEVRRGRRVVV